MILQFPDHETLRLAVTSGLITEEVQNFAAHWAEDSEGTVWIKSDASLPRKEAQALRDLGVKGKRSCKLKMQSLTSWHQIFQVSAEPLEPIGEKTDVLFEITSAEALPTIVDELLRLGNDRQSFRLMQGDVTASVFLRVINPPYYTLLRAIDGLSAASQQVKAYVQQNARVWVEAGFSHPFGNRIDPPSGHWLLIDSENGWRPLEEGPFRDVYEVLEFKLPQNSTALSEKNLDQRIEIPLQLVPAAVREPAELWVLTDNAIDQVEQLVRRSDDTLIGRLAFAVTESQGNCDEPTVVIRARPSRGGPPVLVLDCVAMCPYLKISNLFAPVNARLHPPLRRDAVSDLLAKDSEAVCWLLPREERSFTPQQVHESAFRPLSDWVHYVLDNQHEAMSQWVESHQFDFDAFVCEEDEKQKPPPRKSRRGEKHSSGESNDLPDRASKNRKPSGKTQPGKSEGETQAFLLSEVVAESAAPSELEQRLTDLQSRFAKLESPIDSSARAELWREMGAAHSRLSHQTDTTICWANATWNASNVEPEHFQQWLQCEAVAARQDALSAEVIDQMIAEDNTDRSARGTGIVGSYIVHAAQSVQTTEVARAQHAQLTEFMLARENTLPIRAAWMAWQGLYKITGDVLLLARARDRLLERLFQSGLSPEFDLATFLRSGGDGGAGEFGLARDGLMALEPRVRNWVLEPASGENPQTEAYSALMFAFAFAKIGESSQADRILEECKSLQDHDSLHAWVFDAFQFRIGQALSGASTRGLLSEELIQQQAAIEAVFDRYKIDKLRQQSRILEPQQIVNAYKRQHGPASELEQQLTDLVELSDRDKLRGEFSELLEGKHSAPAQIAIFSAALQAAPRVDEEFATTLLSQVANVMTIAKEAVDQSLVLQKAIFLAAHYGRVDSVQQFVAMFFDSLGDLVDDYLRINVKAEPANQEKIDTIERLFNVSFRGLRKLGMRDEIAKIYGKIAEHLASEAGNRRKNLQQGDPTRRDRLRLCVAGGWYYFGETAEARKIADDVRSKLFAGEFETFQQNSLTCAYLRSVSQADPTEALARIDELFEADKRGNRALPNIEDMSSTKSHFSITQLNVIEAAILAIIGDDISLSAETRRLLDEEEFLIRSRIHRDMQQAVAGI